MHHFSWEPHVAVIVYVTANQLNTSRGNIFFIIAQKKQRSEGGELV
jgi:hypothetical protein